MRVFLLICVDSGCNSIPKQLFIIAEIAVQNVRQVSEKSIKNAQQDKQRYIFFIGRMY